MPKEDNKLVYNEHKDNKSMERNQLQTPHVKQVPSFLANCSHSGKARAPLSNRSPQHGGQGVMPEDHTYLCILNGLPFRHTAHYTTHSPLYMYE